MTQNTQERRWPRPLRTTGAPQNSSSDQTSQPAHDGSTVGTVIHFPRRGGEPSTYGLSPGELAAEVRRCRRAGRYRWELRTRFGRWSA